MAFWNRLFKKEASRTEPAVSISTDRELVKQWIQDIDHTLLTVNQELQKTSSETTAILAKSLQDRTNEVLSKLDDLPERIISPLREIVDLSKQEILNELVRISSNYGAHDSHGSPSAKREIETPIQEIPNSLTGKQRKLLAILLDSGFLSYAEIGEKIGITHESAKNLVNRLLKDDEKARLFSKQEANGKIIVGVSSEVQDEILKKKYRAKPNDSK